MRSRPTLNNSSRVSRRVSSCSNRLAITLSSMAEMYRSPEQATCVVVRMGDDDKAALKKEAADAGLTMQQLAELRLFGEARPLRTPGRRKQAKQPEELPLGMSA